MCFPFDLRNILAHKESYPKILGLDCSDRIRSSNNYLVQKVVGIHLGDMPIGLRKDWSLRNTLGLLPYTQPNPVHLNRYPVDSLSVE